MTRTRRSIGFNLRKKADCSIEEAGEMVGKAFGCVFEFDEDPDTVVVVSSLLGMNLVLGEWGGVGGEIMFQLRGSMPTGEDDPADMEYVETDISAAMIDLLALRGAGVWRKPTRDELRAESDYRPER